MMLKSKRKKLYQQQQRHRIFQWRKKWKIREAEKKVTKLTRVDRASLKKAMNKMSRNIRLRMQLRKHFNWGKATFRRNLDRMIAGPRIPRMKNLSFKLMSDNQTPSL